MDLMIVAREDDALAGCLAEAARAAGREAAHLGLLEAGQRFTVRVGAEATVAPACPVFLRPVFPRDLDREALFHHQEAYACLWSAARLTPAPVLNRPSDWGTPGRYSYIATVNQERCGAVTAAEVFVSPERLGELGAAGDGRAIYVEDQGTFDRSALPDRPAGGGPYRVREDAVHLGYDYVTVVGDTAWRATDVPIDVDLEAASVAAASRLGLGFCVCTWAVTARGAHLTRVDAFPTLQQVRFNWPAISDALLRRLS